MTDLPMVVWRCAMMLGIIVGARVPVKTRKWLRILATIIVGIGQIAVMVLWMIYFGTYPVILAGFLGFVFPFVALQAFR